MSKEEVYPDPDKHWSEKDWQKKIGIFRSFLNKPNESVWDLSELRFGRDTYEHITRVNPNKNKENEKFFMKTEFGHWRLRPNWRNLLDRPDPYALMPIYCDPTVEWCRDDGGILRREYKLWDPHQLTLSFIRPGPVLDNIVRVLDKPGMADCRPLTRAVNIHFRTVYMPEAEKAWRELRDAEEGKWWSKFYADVSWDQHKNRTLRFWDDTSHLVSGALLHHFQVHPDMWFPHLYDSPALEEMMFDAKCKLEHRKAGGMTFNFVE